jgi:hypothetical protein
MGCLWDHVFPFSLVNVGDGPICSVFEKHDAVAYADAMNQLERLQRLRKGDHVPAPLNLLVLGEPRHSRSKRILIRECWVPRLPAIVLALVSCNRGHSPVSSRREISAAEYEVLTAWIDATFTGKERVGKGVVRVVIFDTSQSGDDELLGDENC